MMEPRALEARPCVMLSVHLLETYKLINLAYYKKQRSKEKLANRGKDIQCGLTKETSMDPAKKRKEKHLGDYYVPSEDEVFHDRYRLTGRKMGMGSFGQVVEALDIKTSKKVAIKIIKNHKAFAKQAQSEIQILGYLHSSSGGDANHIVKLLDQFMHKGHQCLVFELLSYNLYELLRSTKFVGVGLKLIRKLTKQMLESLNYLSETSVIHCDLKPENVCLLSPQKSGIKLIDFGSSCKADNKVFTYIQSRFYRAPEVILGMKYTAAIDMWSLGCILVEMHTGEPLFGGQDHLDQLHKIVHVLGMLPNHMIEQAKVLQRNTFFETIPGGGYKIKTQHKLALSSSSTDFVLEKSLPQNTSSSLYDIVSLSGRRLGEPGHTREDYAVFMDLVSKMLTYDPLQRITPAEALNHPFLLQRYHQSPSQSRQMDKKRSPKLEDPMIMEASAQSLDIIMTSGSTEEDEYAHRSKQRKVLLQDKEDTT